MGPIYGRFIPCFLLCLELTLSLPLTMRASKSQNWAVPGLWLAPLQGHCIQASPHQSSGAASHRTEPPCAPSLLELGDPWKCTRPPCLSEFFPKNRVRAKKDVHIGPSEKLTEDPAWGTEQKPALLRTRPAFEHMSHRQPALNLLLGDI